MRNGRWAYLHRWWPQPVLGAVVLLLAVFVVGLDWLRPLSSADTRGPTLLLALGLVVATVAAYQFPLHLRPQTKVYLASVPYYLMAVLLAPPLAATAAGAGALCGEASVRAQRGLTAGPIATEVGRRTLVVWLGALVAHLAVTTPLHTLALVGTALVLALGDLFTFPLVVARVGGEAPRRLIAATARQAALAEGAQYLLGLLGALALAQQGWALALLAWPTALVYLAFRTTAQARRAQQEAERSQRAAEQAQAALRQSEERYRRIVETAQEGIWQLDAEGRTTFVNNTMARLLGYTPEEMCGRAYLDYLDQEDRAAAEQRLVRRRAMTGEPERDEVRLRRQDGSILWALIGVGVLADEGGAYAGAVALITDITARKQAEEDLRASEALYRALWAHTSDSVIILNAEGTIRYVSPSHERLLGRTPQELLGGSPTAYLHPDDRAWLGPRLAAVLRTPGATDTVVVRFRHADGSWRWLESIAANHQNDPAVGGTIIYSRDITARKQAEDALAHQALHDDLTGLPNRTLLSDRLERALLAAQRGQAPVALLLLDLDRFKEVNDTFGHHHGDLLLQEVARRLGGLVRATDTVARLGGDEFAVVLPEGDAAGAVRVAHQLIDALDSPLDLDAHTVHVGASVGIAIYPTHGGDAATLVRRADVAMYLAKRTQSGYAVYDAAQDQHSPQRIALVTALRQALNGDVLTLHYQPQLALSNGRSGTHDQSQRHEGQRVRGVEALVRWQHAARGLIPPDEFIPLAEGTGLIKGLTERVLALALAQCRAWRNAGLLMPVAVNLSAWNLRDPHLEQTVAELLQAHGVPPAWLRLEMTESAIMADTERAVAVLSQLVALGVRVSVDDYGTGYSSLAYLKRLPVDELKIDKSFVRDMAHDETDAAIVRSTIALAHTLGLRAVAEGVEDEATWAQLGAMGCDAAQGYFISRPLPAASLGQWLRATGKVAAERDDRTR